MDVFTFIYTRTKKKCWVTGHLGQGTDNPCGCFGIYVYLTVVHYSRPCKKIFVAYSMYPAFLFILVYFT